MTPTELPDFPDEFLRPSDAYIYGKPGMWAIIIALAPFELDGKVVKTEIGLDAFPWDVKHPRELAGTTHEYSAEQRDEFNIEGAVYFRGGHHPVDVSRVSFGDASDDELHVTVECYFDFSFEDGGFENRSAQIACALKCREPKGVLGYRNIT
ncbi:MAG: hypothetical protein JWO87_1752 [Phycisphaerales bacterium]|nr:hypothetical protein [Phycisphaerales bacterium]